jgi:hypothetical protein
MLSGPDLVKLVSWRNSWPGGSVELSTPSTPAEFTKSDPHIDVFTPAGVSFFLAPTGARLPVFEARSPDPISTMTSQSRNPARRSITGSPKEKCGVA